MLKNNKKCNVIYALFLCIILFLCPMVSYAKDTFYLGNYDKTLYENYVVYEVEDEFRENAYSAKDYFDGLNIGLLGIISSISDDGKEIIYEGTDNAPVIILNTKELKDKVKLLASNDVIIAYGKVSSCDSKEIKIKVNSIEYLEDEKILDYYSWTTSDGTIIYADEFTDEKVNDITYLVKSDWNLDNSIKLLDSAYKGNYYKASNEIIGVHYINKEELESISGEEKSIFNTIKQQNTYQQRLELTAAGDVSVNAKYSVKSNTEKIADNKWKHYYGAGKKSGNKNKKLEVYMCEIEEGLLIVSYEYEEKPNKLSWMSFLLNTIYEE